MYPARRGHRRGRHGHPVPRAGELHRALVTSATSASSRSSGCRTAARTRSRTCGPSRRSGCWPAPSGRRCATATTRQARADGHGRDVRGDGFRQRRRAHPARQRLPDRRPGERLPAAGYPATSRMVPHGMAVSLTAPEAFRFTFAAAPERHLRAAALLAPGADQPADPAQALPRADGADARHRPPGGLAPSGSPRATSTTWSTAR